MHYDVPIALGATFKLYGCSLTTRDLHQHLSAIIKTCFKPNRDIKMFCDDAFSNVNGVQYSCIWKKVGETKTVKTAEYYLTILCPRYKLSFHCLQADTQNCGLQF